jgi:peptidoglycan/xylan/chitin deacetylase (PgdA/CDA1 family)
VTPAPVGPVAGGPSIDRVAGAVATGPSALEDRGLRSRIQRAWRPGAHLRVVLFHHVCVASSPFTDGLEVTMSPAAMQERIRYLKRHYDPVSLDEGLDASSRRSRSHRPVLVTLDDAYGSVAREAAPILRAEGVPAVLFANAAPIVSTHLLTDNLVAYALNTGGPALVAKAARSVTSVAFPSDPGPGSVLSEVVATMTPGEVHRFRSELLEHLPGDPVAEAGRSALYLTAQELGALPASGVAIGSHSYSHVWGRSLDEQAAEDEIVTNARVLGELTGSRIRAFSIPYGRSADVTPAVRHAVARAGHDALFVVEARSNAAQLDAGRIFRVSMRDNSERRCFVQLEVEPRLRNMKDRLRALPASVGPKRRVAAVDPRR